MVVKDVSPMLNKATAKVAKVGKEGGHWYTQQGELIELIAKKKANTGMTRTTLYHARQHQLCPGVTTIIGQCDKPQLTLWRVRQGIMSALTLPRRASETEDEWMKRVEIDMNETANKAKKLGTKIHGALDLHYQGKPFDQAFAKHVAGVRRVIEKHCSNQLSRWLPERAVVHPYGYATKSDLHSEEWCLDFKGTEGDQSHLDRMVHYDNHAMQLAATRAPMSSTMRCAIVYVSRTPHGAASFVEVTQPNLERGWDMFKSLLMYWQAKTNYKPNWAEKIT